MTDPPPTDTRTDIETPTEIRTDVESPTPTQVQSPLNPLAEGALVVLSRDGGLEVLDPGAYDQPIQEAVDRAAAGVSGRVFLPPTVVRDTGPITLPGDVGIYGFGMAASVIEITTPDTDGFRLEPPGRAHRVELDGFQLRGPGLEDDTGVAIHFLNRPDDPANDPADFYVGRLYFRLWRDSIYRVEDSVGPFQCRHDFMRADDCDAGDAAGLIEWRSGYGPANWFGTVVAYPTESASGRNTRVLYQRGGELTFEEITVGGSTGRMVDKQYGRLHVGRLHYEPTSQPSIPDALVHIGGTGSTRIDDVLVDTGRVRYVYELDVDTGDAVLAKPSTKFGEVTDNHVLVSHRLNADRPSFYFGDVSDVDDTANANTGNLRVLGSAGTGLG